MGPQYGCSPGLCKFTIKPILFSWNFFIKLYFSIKTLLGLWDAYISLYIKSQFNPSIAYFGFVLQSSHGHLIPPQNKQRNVSFKSYNDFWVWFIFFFVYDSFKFEKYGESFFLGEFKFKDNWFICFIFSNIIVLFLFWNGANEEFISFKFNFWTFLFVFFELLMILCVLDD